MANRKTRPTSPGRRFGTYPMREELTGSEPNKKLTKGKSSSGGRNTAGRVTARHRGGSAKRRYRQIDFKRTKDGVPARVASIEYDPNRSASIALLNYADGDKRYILAPQGLRVGAQVVSGKARTSRPGTPSRWPASRPAPSSTTSSWFPGRAAGSAGRPGRRFRW
jgi:large subunit ribosomal protein L2